MQSWLNIFVTLLLLVSNVTLFAQNNDELKKSAEESFAQGNYKEAKALYSQLTSFYPKEALYNYRLGACMVLVDSDKNTSLKFLEYAVQQPNVSNEAFYYMGLAYHYNYRFKEAKVYYNKFKAAATKRELKDFPVLRQLRMCENGETLLKNINEVTVQESKLVSRGNFQLSYYLTPEMGRILKVPEELQSAIDKKKNLQTLMHRGKGAYTYFASYGDVEDMGLNLYRVRITEGSIGIPQMLPSTINTQYDEEFPYMSPDGTKFYFASKGHNSMGGYDIFVCDYDSASDQWSKPRNLDFAINTPDDDLLYAISHDPSFAYFSSSRNAEKGKIHVYKVNAGEQPIQTNFLLGEFKSSSGNVATITVENRANGKKVGSYTTQRETGKYTLRLPNGGKFKFIVEVAGSDKIHTGMVETPFLTELRPLKQEMEVVSEEGVERLVIKNIFDEPLTDEDRLLLAQELVEKSKLSNSVNKAPTLNKDEIIANVEQELEKSQAEYQQLNQTAANLYQLASVKAKLAQDELILADQLVGTLSNPDQPTAEEKEKVTEINQLRKEAKEHSLEADMAVKMAEALAQLIDKKEAEVNELQTLSNQSSEMPAEQMALRFNQVPRTSVPAQPVKAVVEQFSSGNSPEAQKAAQLMEQADKLREDKTTLEEDISYYKQQASQTRDRALRKSFESQVEELTVELADVNAKIERKYQQAEELNASSSLDANQKAIAQRIAIEMSGKTASNITLADIDAQSITNKVGTVRNKTATASALSNSAFTGNSSALPNENEPNSSNSEDSQSREEKSTEPVAEEINTEETASQEPVEETSNGTETVPTEELAGNNAQAEVISESEQKNFEQAVRQAEKLDNEYEKEATKREINQQWLASINKEISYLRNELEYNTNVSNKAQKEKRLSTLEEQAEEKRLDIMVSERKMANIAPASNKEILETALEYSAVQDIEDRFFFDYESTYDIENTAERLTEENTINQQYIDALEERLGQSSVSNKESKAIEMLMVAKKERIRENLSLIEEEKNSTEEFVYQGELSFNESSNTEGTESEELASSEEMYTGPSTETETVEETPTEEPVINSESNTEEEAINSVSNLTTAGLLQMQLDSVYEELRLKNEELIEARKKKDRVRIEGEIEEILAEKNRLEDEIDVISSSESQPELAAVPTETETEEVEESAQTPEETYNPDFVEPEGLAETTEGLPTPEQDSIQYVINDLTAQKVGATEAEKAELDLEINRLSALLVADNNLLENTNVEENIAAESATEIEPEEEWEVVESTELSSNTTEKPVEELAATNSSEESTEKEESSENQNSPSASSASIVAKIEAQKEVVATKEAAVLSLRQEILATSGRKKREPLEKELAQAEQEKIEEESNLELYQYQLAVFEIIGERDAAKANQLSDSLNAVIEDYSKDVVVLDRQIAELKTQIDKTWSKKKKRALENELVVKRKKLTTQQDLVAEFRSFIEQLLALYAPELAEGATNNSEENLETVVSEPVESNETNSSTISQETEEFLYKVPSKVNTDIFVKEVSTQPVYTIQNPIPIVNKLPGGLVFKVQVGAFRNPIPPETFKGFAPITGEKTGSGLTRYTAGYFKDFAPADNAKGQIRNLGYSDAFVVAYLNGERVSIARARQMLAEGTVPAAAQNTSTSTASVTTQPGNFKTTRQIKNVRVGDADIQPVASRGELFYTVQIGVYAEQIDPKQTFSLSPINADRTGTGMVRYSTGIFTSVQEASAAKSEIQANGITDAFVTAYYQGQRITIERAKQLSAANTVPTVVEETNTNEPDLSGIPEKTKVAEGEIAFKVEIGPYAGQVPVEETEVILKYNKFGISLRKENNATRYQVGEYTTFEDAKKLEESLQKAGISSAKVIQLRNGEIIE